MLKKYECKIWGFYLRKIFNINVPKLPDLVNLTYVPRLNVRKLWFWQSFWIFFYILELNSLLASQIFNKLQKILYSINIYIIPCKLDLCATWIDQKVWFFRYFWIFLYILDLNLLLASQIFTKLKKRVNSIKIFNVPCGEHNRDVTYQT